MKKSLLKYKRSFLLFPSLKMRKKIMISIEEIENLKFIDNQYYLKMFLLWIWFYIVERFFFKQNHFSLFLYFLKKKLQFQFVVNQKPIFFCNKPKVDIISSAQKRNLLSNRRQNFVRRWFDSTLRLQNAMIFWSRLEREKMVWLQRHFGLFIQHWLRLKLSDSHRRQCAPSSERR